MNKPIQRLRDSLDWSFFWAFFVFGLVFIVGSVALGLLL